MPDPGEWEWIEDAAKRTGYSRAWLDEQVRAGKVRYRYGDGGDRRTYLSIADVDRTVALAPGKPGPRRRPADEGGEAQAV